MVATFNPSWGRIVYGLRLAVLAAGGDPPMTYQASLAGAIKAIDDLRAAIIAGGSVTTAINNHVAASDPHPQYALDTDLSSYATTTNLANHTSNTSNPHAATAAQTGALAITSNLSDLNNASTSRTNLGLGNSATRAVGTIAGTVAAGDDSRFTDASTHIAASTQVHGLPASVKVLGNRNLAGEYVQRGTATPNGTLGNITVGQFRDISVSFPSAYSTAPLVVAVCVTGYIGAVVSVSSSGCTLRVIGPSAFAASFDVSYIAIGS
jgi:hypothetical protein